MDDVTTMLGRPHILRGTVVPGDQRGRQLGFPTANLGILKDCMLPMAGVYAGRVWAEGLTSHPCVLNVGSNPTFGGVTPRAEVHVLHYTGDLYGKPLEVSIEHFLREEVRFASKEELISQIQKDADNASEWLG